MKEILKNIWNRLNNNKTVIMSIIDTTIIFLLAKGMIDNDTAIFIGSIAGALTGGAIYHNIKKNGFLKLENKEKPDVNPNNN